MITKNIDRTRSDSNGVFATDYIGLSTDDKPLDATNGSTFLEMNTGNVYVFNEASLTWVVL